ncbi:hypothetical protein ANO11243_000820 [Dothideomycetidae sp. 11243]|nr:hypothetical protein ANO11243_000820 [fungal sp. No.11243]
MRVSQALRRYACRITLFTRDNCSLCNDAKHVLSKVWDRRPYEYDEVDVMAEDQNSWKSVYEFDTPVIHIDKTLEGNQRFQTTTAALKLMHRFREDQIEQMMDQAMLSAPSPSK